MPFVAGDVAATPPDHAALQLIRQRKREGSKPGARRAEDTAHVALVIEGGGMRGCVSAGMASALLHFGYVDAFDSIYGSSAGSMIGAYMMTDPPLKEASSIYTDSLTGEGRHFIDTRQFMRCLGLGIVGLPLTGLRGLVNLLTDRLGKPVLNLDYLLKDTLQGDKMLDWEKFAARYVSSGRCLKPAWNCVLCSRAFGLNCTV